MTDERSLMIRESDHGHSPLAWTDEQIDLAKRTIARGTTDDEFRLFLAVCRRTRLDPFARQIYAVVRQEWDAEKGTRVPKMSIQIGIDGYRILALRSGRYAGQVGPQWCGPDGVWRDVWLGEEPPAAARVGILRSDWREPLWAVARWSSYAQRVGRDQRVGAMWARMPDLMLANAAERLAIRKACPFDFAGLPIEEGDDTDDAPTGSAAVNGQHVPVAPPAPARHLPAPATPQLSPHWDELLQLREMADDLSVPVPREAAGPMDHAAIVRELTALRQALSEIEADEVDAPAPVAGEWTEDVPSGQERPPQVAPQTQPPLLTAPSRVEPRNPALWRQIEALHAAAEMAGVARALPDHQESDDYLSDWLRAQQTAMQQKQASGTRTGGRR